MYEMSRDKSISCPIQYATIRNNVTYLVNDKTRFVCLLQQYHNHNIKKKH